MQLTRTSVLIAPVLILLLFAPMLAGLDRLAFRDVSHFYTPLYDYVASRSSQQWFPLWNPLDQTGVPLTGETTTAVFYPLRYVLFALPISSECAIVWYVALHLILASLTARLAARWAELGPTAANLVSILYPLSGSVLFLYTNPPYLVGAAWLPLALGAMLARQHRSDRSRILIAGGSMAMMIMGGDPQTAFHTMIVASLVWIVQLLRRSRQDITFGLLLAAPILAAVLAAPQLAASISWSRQSDRIRSSENDSWIEPPIVGSRRYESYQYSLAPWHTLELVTPNAFGSMLPVNARLSRLIPGDGRTWTPSIYMGMLALLAIIFRLVRLHIDGIDTWLAIAAASLWLAMGHFGVVWLIQTTTHNLPQFDSAIGGPYWWLYQLVPGYDSFRYPAKWLPLFSLAASITTAQFIQDHWGIKQDVRKRGVWNDRLIAPILAIGVILVAALAAVLLLRVRPSLIFDPTMIVPKDEFWGPLNVSTALSQVTRSIIHSIIVLLTIVAVFRLRQSQRCPDQASTWMLLLIVAIDLSVCGHETIASVSRKEERALIKGLDQASQPIHSRWLRTQTDGGWPQQWRQTQDSHRLADVEASIRASWFGRWHLKDRVSVLNNMVSIQSKEAAIFWKSTHKATAGMNPSEREQFWSSMRRWLVIDGIVHTTGQTADVSVTGRKAQLIDRHDMFRTAGESLRFHAHWTYDESLRKRFVQRLKVIAQTGGIITPTLQCKPTDIIPSTTNDHGAAIKTISRNAEKEEFVVHLNDSGLLTRPVLQDGHWFAEYCAVKSNRWKAIPVHRVDLMTQGVLLPAGNWKLRFQYSPWWLGWSLGIALIGWMFMAITLARQPTVPGSSFPRVPVAAEVASSTDHPER